MRGAASLKQEFSSKSQVGTTGTAPQVAGHRVFSNGHWKNAKFRDHPRVGITLKAEGSSVTAVINAIVDCGAQPNLWSFAEFKKAGFTSDLLSPAAVNISAADDHPMSIVGTLECTLQGRSPEGDIITTRSLVYVSDAVVGFFLSYDTMLNMGIVDHQFPRVGSHKPSYHDPDTRDLREERQAHFRLLNSGCPDMCETAVPCNCPQRTDVPDKPTSLPYHATAENNEKMRSWLLERYSSSTFNTCPHRPLQQMAGPPIEIHLDERATPRACHTAKPIPLHWQERVREDLMRDEALGVIEQVPYGEPVEWCHRMVVTRKHDGTPRRTVDLSPLNKYCKRETHVSESPFVLARRVPGNTWKTVTDAWNGYHSVPLRESDRHLTTFITPYGRYRYKRAPQGFLSSGDGYNRRFQALLSGFQRMERCVDDTIHYDRNLEDHWWRTIDFLSKVGSSGVVLNPDKFQFAQREVDFAGFRIAEDNIKPLPRYLDAIQNFPVPSNTTDVRSWFGLVNQVSNYAQLRDHMAPFRVFLRKSQKFYWNEELNRVFEESKAAIIRMIEEGVRIFDITKATCLRTDWSVRGIGYLLMQKNCTCKSDIPGCCHDGWGITLAGSRFLNDTEANYAAIDGEALAIAWSLEQTRYFTQGCSNLVVVTDHKPLLKIFSDRTLDEITNTRLFRLKRRTLPWHFRIVHMPGTSNSAADAMSRHPSSVPTINNVNKTCPADLEESLIVAGINRDIKKEFSLSWTSLAEATARDEVLQKLVRAIAEDFSDVYLGIEQYTRYRGSLWTQDGVVMYMDRVVVPSSLRPVVLEHLHSAHQGTSSMELRAQSIVFWPGMSHDVRQARSSCSECNRNAPSQAALPPEPSNPPTTPFEQVFSDFFQFGGNNYLVVGDRLSGWTEVYSTPSGSQRSGARGLVQCLRSFFATFGVPDELSSDGGPEFMADSTKQFLQQWNVQHRISSAYFPQSNGRAEVAVKAAKRLLRSNVGPNGTLQNDRFLRAMLQLRNTPDPDCNLSPAQIVFGRQLRDAFAFTKQIRKLSSSTVRPQWTDAWRQKELALRKRFIRWHENLGEHSKNLHPLRVGDRCFVQNQHGLHPKRWDRSGTVVEVLPHHQFMVKIDGSGRLTRRNRRFLRLLEQATTDIAPSTHRQLDKLSPANDSPHLTLDPRDMVTPADAMPANETPANDTVTTAEAIETSREDTEGCETIVPRSQVRRAPLMLRRLQDHNSPGLAETAAPASPRRLRSR